jgi:hypothetical protein
MHERNDRHPRRLSGSQTDRLVRDLMVFDILDPDRPTATERLDAKLGPDLVAAIRAELKRSTPGRRKPRRVA